MAVSPTVLDAKLQREADHYEKIMDDLLLNCKMGAGRTVRIDVPANMNHSHLEILRARYTKAGWSKIEWKSDQREGSWLTFTA